MKQKMQYPDVIFEVIGWLTIVGGFAILGGTSGLLLAAKIEGTPGIIIGGFICLTLIYIGVRVANNSHKDESVLQLLSESMAAPKADKKSAER